MKKKRKDYRLEIKISIIEDGVNVIQEDARRFVLPGDVMRMADGTLEPSDEQERLALDRIKHILDNDLVDCR